MVSSAAPAQVASEPSAEGRAGDLAATTRGPASSHDPYGALVPLRVVPKVRVLDPAGAAGADLAPVTPPGVAPASFTHAAWSVPRSFEAPPPRREVVPLPPPHEERPHPPVIVRRSVAVPPLRRAAAPVVKVRAAPAKLDRGRRERDEPPPSVALPSVLAPTSQP